MYRVITTGDFDRQFRKLDRSVQILIRKWIDKHLVNCTDPRAYGKGLITDLKGYWRYRIGDYRLLAEIRDNELVIVAVAIAHRSRIYGDRN
ncbi:MAG: type II toxin-antitoxin system RelE/ParE family toxin [Lachnospiraceae bacterium]|nr:type II toxin-antitoxin system RelE/ParE family toxin [Lachnospiraceae bacterium]